MALYETSQLNDIPQCFNSINKKIEESVNEFTDSFDYDNLKQLIIDIKKEYNELKTKIADFSVELRINILEIDDLKVFEKYKKYCAIRAKAIHKLLEPQDIDLNLNAYDDKYLSHADISKYSYFKVPQILNIFNLSGYLYTYSFMLLILKKSVIGIIDNLQFQNSSNAELELFDEKELSDASATLKQKVLLIKYLEKAGFLNLTKIHQDRSKQTAIVSFLITQSHKTTYDALGDTIDNLITRKNLDALKSMFEPIKDAFPQIIKEIDKDLKKLKI